MEWVILGLIILFVWSLFTKNGSDRHMTPDPVVNDDPETEYQLRYVGTSSYRREKSKNKQPGRWVRPGEVIQVGKHIINQGNIYFGGVLNALVTGETEASLVDDTLKLNFRKPDTEGHFMGYWSHYAHLRPESRAAYIQFLESDRSDPNTYIGYVFLYYYGLERRILVDTPVRGYDDSELKALLEEVERLRQTFKHDRSFYRYSSELLSHAWLVFRSDSRETPSHDVLVNGRGFTSVFRFVLATTVANHRPVDGELALAWIRSHPDHSLRTAARRCKEEFDTLFKRRYKEKYGEGLVITPNKTKLRLAYRPASPSLSGYDSQRGIDLPDPSCLTAPVKKLMLIAEACTDELDSYSRYIARQGVESNSLSAQSLLPETLLNDSVSFEVHKLRNWLQDYSSQLRSLVDIDRLRTAMSLAVGETPKRKEMQEIAAILQKFGYGIAPDVRFHGELPQGTHEVVIFPGGHHASFNPSSVYEEALLRVRVGSMVAIVDGEVVTQEVDYLAKMVDSDVRLNDDEKASLMAYLMWRLRVKPSMTGIKAKVNKLSSNERHAVKLLLLGVVVADGRIDPREVQQVEKMYDALGFDKGTVASDIHAVSTDKGGSVLRTRPSSSEPTNDTVSDFELDTRLIEHHRKETQDVHSVLGAIFTEDEDETPVIDEPADQASTNPAFDGLDPAYVSLYKRVVVQEKWSIDEFGSLCEELSLMPGGAMETLNDWAYDLVDAPLIEDGSDQVYVDLEIVQEIAELTSKN